MFRNRLSGYVAVLWALLVLDTGPARGTAGGGSACASCRQSLRAIRTLHQEFEQGLASTLPLRTYAPAHYPLIAVPRSADSQTWSDPQTDSPSEPSLFFQRLEALHSFENGKQRLGQIETILQRLEQEIAEEESHLGENPSEDQRRNLSRLKRLAQTQRLIVDELKRQLEAIEKRFRELDSRIDAHEQRIQAFEGELEGLSGEFRKLAREVKAHAVTRNEAAYEGVREFLKANEEEPTVGARFWKFPRTELRYEEMGTATTEVTTSIEGNLFGVVNGEAKGGLVYEVKLSTDTFLVAPGTNALLGRNGATLRNAALFCTVAKTFTLKGFGSISGSGGLNAVVVKTSTGVRYERGQTFAATSKRYSEMTEVPQGETYERQIEKCREFTRSILDKEDLGREVSSMTRVVQIPETTCYRDYDCRRDVSLGVLMPSVISQCFPEKNRQQAVCQHRYVDVVGTCSLPGERIYNFRYYCAKGYRCDPESRECRKITSRQARLKVVGLKEAKVVDLDARHAAVADADPAWYCRELGRLPANEGWRLPKREELDAVALWFRDFAQENLRTSHRNISAQSWFYPWQAHTGLVWAGSSWVYLLANDSLARYNPADEENRKRFTDPKTGKAVDRGVAICVR